MLLLAFDTATPAVTVAVHDGSAVVAQRSAVDARRHGELLAAQIAGALADCGATRADLTAIAVGTGPGPYTGLRVGLVTARVLASVLDIPLYGVCSLDVIAQGGSRRGGGPRVHRRHRRAAQGGLLGALLARRATASADRP